MKYLVRIGMLVAMALVLRSWAQTSLALGISIHDTYRAVFSESSPVADGDCVCRVVGCRPSMP
jgi:hypothetical protein